GVFHMWYNSHLGSGHAPIDPPLRNRNGDLVLYATSRDGVHWVRPNLGIYAFGGSRDNNIVYDMHSPNVIVDAREADPARRYKMVGYRGGSPRGYFGAYSADGLHWTEVSKSPILGHGDTVTATRDPASGR